MSPDWTWWALLLNAIGGLVVCTGLLTRFRDAAVVLALVLFAVSLALALIPIVSR